MKKIVKIALGAAIIGLAVKVVKDILAADAEEKCHDVDVEKHEEIVESE